MRIYELAKELGIDSKELIERLKGMNFPVKNHMSSVDSDTAEVIKHEIEDSTKKEIEGNLIEVDFPISVKELSVRLNKKPSEVLKVLLKEGKLYNINYNLDEKTARAVAYLYKVNLAKKPSPEEEISWVSSQGQEKRSPVVTLMGHIDHGKTSILDYIRKSKIVSKETGGITQHIGAYHLDLDKGSITFLDTPGHETFTAMRARGADVTDIVIIVVAADEGVKPQTSEAIDHAKQAGVPIIVAINKIDKPNANVDMVKQHLSKHDLVPEDWGGKTTTVEVSAKTGKGIDDLLDIIILHSDIMELKALFDRAAIGVVIEAKLSRGRGPVATVLIEQGTLKLSDICVCGTWWGKVRALHDDRGKLVNKAHPSFPVEVIGLNGVPVPGDKLFVVANEKKARDIVEHRKEEEREKKQTKPMHLKLEDLHKKMQEESLKQLKLVLKADVGGSLEAISDALGKFPSQEIEIQFVHKGVGAINLSDVLLAEVSDAVVMGFKVNVDPPAKRAARTKGIQVRVYQIVYELIDDVKAALEGMLTPQIRRVFMGRAKVNKVFKLSRMGVIAGCIVQKGKIIRGARCELTRDNKVIVDGKVTSLKRFKDDAREVLEGFECGIGIGYSDIRDGDYMDVFSEEIISRKI